MESGQDIGLNYQYGSLLVKIGEAEKKIMDNIIKNRNSNSKYLIYSPDNDVILLASLLGTSILQRNK